MSVKDEQIKYLQYRVEALEKELKKKDAKILVSDDAFLSCVDELATQITEMNYGAEAYDVDDSENLVFTEEAQDYYNEMFCEYEELINATLNVWNKQREI